MKARRQRKSWTGSAAKIAAAVGLEVKTLFTVTSDAAPLAPATIRSYHRTISSI